MEPLAPDLPPPRAFPWWGMRPRGCCRGCGSSCAITDGLDRPRRDRLAGDRVRGLRGWAILTFSFHRWVAAATAYVAPRCAWWRSSARDCPANRTAARPGDHGRVGQRAQHEPMARPGRRDDDGDATPTSSSRSRWARSSLGALQEHTTDYPYTRDRERQSMWSRWPVEALPLADGLPRIGSRELAIDADGERVIVYVVHLFNPSHETTFAAQQAIGRPTAGGHRRRDRSRDRGGRPEPVRSLRGLPDAGRPLHRRDAHRVVGAQHLSARPVARALLLRIDQIFVPLGLVHGRRQDLRGSGLGPHGGSSRPSALVPRSRSRRTCTKLVPCAPLTIEPGTRPGSRSGTIPAHRRWWPTSGGSS